MHVKYLKKINIDYSSLLYYYKSYNFKKNNNTCNQNKKNVKFPYKPYYIFICTDFKRNIIKRIQHKFYLIR